MQNQKSKYFSLFIIGVALIAFLYIVAKAAIIVDKRQIGTDEGIYTNMVTTSEEIKTKSIELSRGCASELCSVQRVLDYVTKIPYKINHFQAHTPQKTIQNHFGDCDDKSNLLISMLHALGVESYFVLVPEHIFVIVRLDDPRLVSKKALYVDGRRFYILESTAEDSSVGFPLHYKLSQISAIVEPFTNEKVKFDYLEYK